MLLNYGFVIDRGDRGFLILHQCRYGIRLIQALPIRQVVYLTFERWWTLLHSHNS